MNYFYFVWARLWRIGLGRPGQKKLQPKMPMSFEAFMLHRLDTITLVRLGAGSVRDIGNPDL